MSSINQIINLTVDKLAIGASGIGKDPQGRVIFVPDSCPGDELQVEVIKEKKNFAEARILKIQQPSIHRRPPPCSLAESCGGCQWQHIDEEEQRKQKQLLLKETLEKFLRTSVILEPLIPSPKSLRYRNRIRPHIEGLEWGFREKKSHKLVPFEDCLLVEEILAKELFRVKKEVLASLPKNQNFDSIEIYLSEDEKVQWTFLNQREGVGFSQVNRFQNEDLKSCVLAELAKAPINVEKKIWDLYAGSGNFTFFIAEKFPQNQVIGVEMSSLLMKKARMQKGFKNLLFFHSDVEIFLKRAPLEKNDTVILDPPRAGCSPKIIELLKESGVEKIIYISCNPVSLARDLQSFLNLKTLTKARYTISKIQPFEMFPQTEHMETIVVLNIDRSSDSDTLI